VRKTLLGVVMAFCLLGASAPAASQATTPVTIGQLAPANPSPACSGGPNDIIQAALASGTSYVVPTDGTITQWSTNAAAGAGQMLKMKVFRPVTGTTYTVVGHDGARALTPSVLNTFTVSIPVKAGDLIGLNDQNAPAHSNACLFTTGQAGDVFGASAAIGDAADGSSETILPIIGGYRLNLTATLAPTPTGQRAAALKKCKRKHSKRARRKCRKKANLLPA